MSRNESVVQPESSIPLNLTTENFWETFEYAVSQKDSLWLLVSTGLIFLMVKSDFSKNLLFIDLKK